MKRILLAALPCSAAAPSIAAELPSAIAANGAITAAVVPTYPPLDGSSKALLDRWQLSENRVEKATIDAGQ